MARNTRDALLLAENLDNVGDFALLVQAIHGLRRSEKIGAIAVRQWSQPDPEIVAKLKALDVQIVPAKTVGALWPGRKLLLYPGGQAIRGNASPASMLAMAVTVVLSRLVGGKRAALAIGASEVTDPRTRKAWRFILSRFDLVACRDSGSLERARTLTDASRLTLTDDLVFAPSPLHEALASSGQRQHLIIAPCCDASEDRILDPEQTVELARAVAAQCGVSRILIVCHDPRPGMDQEIATAIAKAAGNAGLHDVKVIASASLEDVAATYRDAAAVLTNRLHAMIFGLLASKPVLAIDDGNDKVRTFAQRFDVPLLPQAKGDITAQIEAGIANASSASRSRSVEQAKAEAARNFTLLDAIL